VSSRQVTKKIGKEGIKAKTGKINIIIIYLIKGKYNDLCLIFNIFFSNLAFFSLETLNIYFHYFLNKGRQMI
jgi:hypothetical protein